MMGMLPGMGQMGDMVKAMSSPEATQEIRRMCGIIDSMTPSERTDPDIIEPRRRQRIAEGAGVQPKAVNELVKQFNQMKPILTGMAGGSVNDRKAMMDQLQDKMMNPAGKMPKTKKSTGKRLTPKERAKMKKQRDKMLKNKRKNKKKR